MGRHALDKNNVSLSKGVVWAIALLSAVTLAIALVMVYRSNRDDTADPPTCIGGDLPLPVAASTRSVGQELIDSYRDTSPVVRDFCIKPELTDSLADAAVYVAPLTSISRQELLAAERSTATNEPPTVYSSAVGIAGASEADPAGTPISQVVFPTGDQPEASAIVASSLASNDNDAVAALTDQRAESTDGATLNSTTFVATGKDFVPDGFTFSPLDDTAIVYSAIPLNATDAVSEDQVRAGQDFVEHAKQEFAGSDEAEAQLPMIGETVWAAARPNGGSRITDNPDKHIEDETSALTATDTLFVVDTSSDMRDYLEDVTSAVAEAAEEVSKEHRVGLWNYSSPLNPGINKGYRRNVAVGNDPTYIVDVAPRLTADGVPQTREAVIAAVATAQSEVVDDAPLRVVLITSGTADRGNDDDLTEAIAEAGEHGVYLSVVHVGDGGEDEVLMDAADYSVKASDSANTANVIRKATGL